MTTSMTASSSVRWQDFFREEPCEHGWSSFAEAVEMHGLHTAVKWAPLSSRRWGAEHTYRTDILLILAQDADDGVRRYVASNPQTPAEMLAKLATDKNCYVRRCVSKSANTPAEVLSALAHDANDYVRRNVALNANTPVEVLSVLAHDANDYVRDVAQDRLRPIEPSLDH
jgi:hypothetical protein